jgi:hypothetical protein
MTNTYTGAPGTLPPDIGTFPAPPHFSDTENAAQCFQAIGEIRCLMRRVDILRDEIKVSGERDFAAIGNRHGLRSAIAHLKEASGLLEVAALQWIAWSTPSADGGGSQL